MPESDIFCAAEELKEKLEELRNSTLLVFAVSNLIWIILLLTLTHQGYLKVLGTNAISFAFLAVYGFIIVIQFLTVLWHRMATFFHVLARTPWKRGALNMVEWKFDQRNPEEISIDGTIISVGIINAGCLPEEAISSVADRTGEESYC